MKIKNISQIMRICINAVAGVVFHSRSAPAD
jgi:hypothetical protein